MVARLFAKPMRIFLISSLLLCLVVFITGCGTVGGFVPATETRANLERANFKVVQTGVSGSATANYIGLPGYGILLGLTPNLYKDAMKELEAKADVANKPRALINVTEDRSIWTIYILSRITVTLTADVIEFTE